MITLLQHTHPKLAHYGDEEWDWLRGALATVDRSFGILDFFHHHIADTHVCHHLFSTIPHYHAQEVCFFTLFFLLCHLAAIFHSQAVGSASMWYLKDQALAGFSPGRCKVLGRLPKAYDWAQCICWSYLRHLSTNKWTDHWCYHCMNWGCSCMLGTVQAMQNKAPAINIKKSWKDLKCTNTSGSVM